jgi:hypothetical protein
MRWILLSLLVARLAAAQSAPALDDFYERTRQRDDGFTDCIGYCDGNNLAAMLVGAQTANPSTDMLQPHLASGVRLGVDLGARRNEVDIVRTQLWADLLRVHDTGAWITDLGWHVTAFKSKGKPTGDESVHLSLDSVIARRTEIQPSDVAELQLVPYDTIDVEAEAAPTFGPGDDKNGVLTLPIGVENRLRWSDGLSLERRTSFSGALALRAFPHGLRHHAQFDLLRIKQTSWDVPGGSASAWTMSGGFQRLPVGIDTLPIWALVGYEWAGPRDGVVYRVGGAFVWDELELGPEAERHFELDPVTASFSRVDSGRFRVGVHYGPVRWSVAYESVSIQDRGSLRALGSTIGVTIHGLQLGAGYRLVWTRDLMFPPSRFQAGLDWLF